MEAARSSARTRGSSQKILSCWRRPEECCCSQTRSATRSGMSVSRSIVRRHNGQMLVETGARPGHSGTVLRCSCPAAGGIRAEHDSRLERAARPEQRDLRCAAAPGNLRHTDGTIAGSDGRRGGDRTHNPRLRRPVLYPIELLAHALLIVALNRFERCETVLRQHAIRKDSERGRKRTRRHSAAFVPQAVR